MDKEKITLCHCYNELICNKEKRGILMDNEKISSYLDRIDSCFDVGLGAEELTTNNFYEYISYDSEEVQVFSGASKLVFIFEDCDDYVFKMPFKNDGDDYPFEFAWNEEGEGDDYCEAEALFYQSAVKSSLSSFFAKTEFVGYIQGTTPIYMQEKCDIFERGDKSKSSVRVSEEDERSAMSFCESNEKECFNERWIAEAIALYGQKKTKDLLDFLEEMDINDLHTGNVGYLKGNPVLIDYSGFHG